LVCDTPLETFLYKRHAGALLAAVVLLFLFTRWDLFNEPFLPTFALSGALHAAALCVALRAPAGAARKCLFIAVTALMSILTLYIGIVSLQLFALLPATERLYFVLGICAVAGAITYGSLVRFFWMKKLSPRSILAIAVVCVPATYVAFLARTHFEVLGAWVLAPAWWCAFSGGLMYFDRLVKPAPERR
jgi:hypothetical protein